MRAEGRKKMLVVSVLLSLLSVGCAKLNPKFEESLDNALRAKSGEFERCYEAALKKDRNTGGEMALALEFEPKSTAPKNVEVTASRIKDGAMKQCVVSAAKAVETAELPGTWVDGKYTLDFQSK